MKQLYLIAILGCILAPLFSTAQTVYTDPLIGTVLNLPENSKQVDTQEGYNATYALPQGSIMSIKTYKNKDKGEHYTWSQLSSCDPFNFDNLLSQTKVGEKIDGWHRLYQVPSSKGGNYYAMITLIRGNDDALYIIETANDSTAIQSPAIVQTSEVPRFTKTIRNGRLNGWILFLLAFIAFSCFFVGKVKAGWKGKTKFIVALAIVAFTYILLLWLTYLSLTTILVASLIVGAIWMAYLISSDDGNFLEGIVSNAVDELM